MPQSKSSLKLKHDKEFNILQWPSQSLDLNPIEYLCDVLEQDIRSMNVHQTQSAEIAWCNHVNMEQNPKEMFSTYCGIHATKNWGS